MHCVWTKYLHELSYAVISVLGLIKLVLNMMFQFIEGGESMRGRFKVNKRRDHMLYCLIT